MNFVLIFDCYFYTNELRISQKQNLPVQLYFAGGGASGVDSYGGTHGLPRQRRVDLLDDVARRAKRQDSR